MCIYNELCNYVYIMHLYVLGYVFNYYWNCYHVNQAPSKSNTRVPTKQIQLSKYGACDAQNLVRQLC